MFWKGRFCQSVWFLQSPAQQFRLNDLGFYFIQYTAVIDHKGFFCKFQGSLYLYNPICICTHYRKRFCSDVISRSVSHILPKICLNLQGKRSKKLNACTRHHVLGICVQPALTDLHSEHQDLYSLCLIERLRTQDLGLTSHLYDKRSDVAIGGIEP